MKKNKSEIVYWLFFIIILMAISISIILYFRLPRSLDYEHEENTITQDKIIVK